MKNHSICVIIPAYNEEMTIGKVIDEIPRQALENEGYRIDIPLGDNNCSDGIGDIARSKKARIIVEPRRGKGRAAKTCISETEADFIFILDADYTYPAGLIPKMLSVLKDSPVVIGSPAQSVERKGCHKPDQLAG